MSVPTEINSLTKKKLIFFRKTAAKKCYFFMYVIQLYSAKLRVSVKYSIFCVPHNINYSHSTHIYTSITIKLNETTQKKEEEEIAAIAAAAT